MACTLCVAFGCGEKGVNLSPLAQAENLETQGQLLEARDKYHTVIAGCQDPELKALLEIRTAKLSWKLHQEGRALETLHRVAEQRPRLAMVALSTVIDLQQARGRSDAVLETQVKLLELVLDGHDMRLAGSSLARMALEKMDIMIDEGNLTMALELGTALARRVPDLLLDDGIARKLRQIRKVQQKAKNVQLAQSDRLTAQSPKQPKKIPRGVLDYYAKNDGESTLSPDENWILTRKRDSSGMVYVFVGRVGETMKKLIGSQGAVRPSWTRQGRGVVWTRFNAGTMTRSIHSISREGGEVKTLFSAGKILGLTAAWSPVADKVAFVYAGDIWVMDGEGRNLQEISMGLDLSRQSPLGWSRDGTRIYFEPYQQKGKSVVKSGPVRVLILEEA